MSDHGPNVTKLIIKCMAREAIPEGGDIADGLRFLTDIEYRKQVMTNAENKAMGFIEAIKNAPDNPYGNDDEIIAKILLDKIAERLGKNERPTK